MAGYNGMILTKAGQQLQAQAQIGGELRITKIAVGDGILTAGENYEDLVALKSLKMALGIQDMQVINGQSRIRALISNDNLNTGFFVREVGVFAKIGDTGNETLYSYTNAADKADYLPNKGINVVEEVLEVYIVVGNAQNVTCIINDRVTLATKQDIIEHKTASTLDHPDNSVTDAKIGNRTITDTTTAVTGANTLTKLLSMLGNMIKRITGKSNWYTAPAITLEDAGNHVNATGAVHGAIDTNMATTLVMRNSSGNFAANIITAELNGNAKTATNATTHIAATSGAHAASAISSTATGDVTVTNVQAAITELASKKAALSGAVFTGAITGSLGGVSNTTINNNAHGAIELGDLNGTATIGSLSPFIDFHHAVGSQQDYNVRQTNDRDGAMTFYGNAINALEISCSGRLNGVRHGFMLGYTGAYGYLDYDTAGSQVRLSALNNLVLGINSNDAHNSNTFTEYMRLTSGKVGLGTSVPAYNLDVVGNINASTGVYSNGKEVACIVASGSGTGYYWRKWSNGDIEQWVRGTAQTGADAAQVITLPLQFPTACLFAQVSTMSTGSNVDDCIFQRTAMSTSSVTVFKAIFSGNYGTATPEIYCIGK